MADNQLIQKALNWERIANSPARTHLNWGDRVVAAMEDFSGTGVVGTPVFSDADLQLYNEAVQSKIVEYDLTGISAGTTRTFIFPDVNGTFALLDATQTLLNKTLTAPVIDMGGNKITDLGTPTLSGDAVTKAYADALTTGTFWADVAVATTANITLGTDLDIGDIIDGYVLVAADRILVKNQTAGGQNGLYDVGGTRSADANTDIEIIERKCIPLNGTVGAETLFFCTTPAITLETTPIEFVKLTVDAVPPVAITTFADGSFEIYNTGDITKRILFDATGVGTGQARTVTMPDADGTILTDTQFTDLTDAGDSALHYHATDRNRTNHTGTQLAATISDLSTAINAEVAANTLDGTFRIGNTADPTKLIAFDASQILTGNARTVTMPDENGTILTTSNAVDLTDAGTSALHYHATDRDRANHTGTQVAATISDFTAAVNASVAQSVNAAIQIIKSETGGAFTSGAWRVRALDDTTGPTLATIAANTATIAAGQGGQYKISAQATSTGAGNNKLALKYNGSVTDLGINSSTDQSSMSTVKTLQPGDSLQLVHRATTTGTFGAPNAEGDVLLIHSDTTNGSTIFTDSALGHVVTPVGNVEHSTTVVKPNFGTTSIKFDGAGDYLTTANHADFNFGNTSDFIISFWFYLSSLVGTVPFLHKLVGGSDLGYYVEFNGSNNELKLITTGATTTRSWSASLSTWYYLALVRDNGNFQFYIDGAAIGAPFTASMTDGTVPLNFGHGDVTYLNGYMDEIKMSTVLPGDYTPPTAPYAPQTGENIYAQLELMRMV